MANEATAYHKATVLTAEQIAWLYRNFDASLLATSTDTPKSALLNGATWDGLYAMVNADVEEANNASWQQEINAERNDGDIQLARYEPGDPQHEWQAIAGGLGSIAVVILLQEAASGGGIELRGEDTITLEAGQGVIFRFPTEYRGLPVTSGAADILIIRFPARDGGIVGPRRTEAFFRQGGAMTTNGYNNNGDPIWVNIYIALGELGNHIPKSVGISPPNEILEKAWDFYGRRIYEGSDTPMPTWTELVDAQDAYLLRTRKADTVTSLRAEGKRRITVDAYGATSFDDELADRFRKFLNGDDTKAEDAERERLRAKYREIRDTINAAADEAAVLAINFRGDALWAP